MIPQAGRHYLANPVSPICAPKLAAYRIAWNNWPVWPNMRDFAAFVSLSSWTSPRSLAGVGANVPGGARAFRCKMVQAVRAGLAQGLA
jgi:hypothetical protein